MKARYSGFLLIGLLLAGAATARAQGQPIEEIIVTGELREATLFDSSASISVIDLEDQRSGTVNHLEEILGWVPNVNFASGGGRARFVQMRGIGERGQFEEPLNPSVGLVLDGVDLSGIGVTATLFDVDQVEVLRGPQGTLYGANALAGLINVRSNDPTAEFESRLRLEAGDYGARGVGGVVSGPLSETLGYRIAAQRYQDDGFMKNRFLGRDDVADHDELTIRGKLLWTPQPEQTWTFAAGYVDADNGYDAFSLDNDRTTLSDEPGQDQQQTGYGSVHVTWALNDAVDFVGTFGGSRSDSDYGYDEDWSFEGFHPDGYSSTDRYLRERDSVSLDLRLLSGPDGRLWGDSTDWLVGLYALDQTSDLERQYTFLAEDFTSRFETRRLAAYGELEHAFTKRTRLIFGLRAERHSADYGNSDAVRFSPTDHMLGGRLVLEHDATDSVMGYLSATRGYKVGGFNVSGTLDPALREYDPETVWNYEAGLKGTWLDGRLSARGSAFYMQRDDVQVATSITIERDDGSVEFIDLVSNAAEGRNRGLELEVDYRPLAALSLFASLGILDTRFDDFVNNNGEDLGGEAQAHAPDYQFFAGAEYRFAPGWYLRVEAEGKDRFYFSNSNRFVPDPDDVRSDAYELWNASVGYEAAHWKLKLWGRNLTDEAYAVRGFYFGNDPRTGYEPNGWFQFGEPRRYGVTVTLWN
ncbi:MAG: TonB-dependent receptor [Gammaproteobacteria bacterium]|nr:TonB-dependent receptor [Gammaproteobacteria bacterium]